MRIYIDESGSFVRGSGKDSLSMVGALVVPEKRWSFLKMQYAQLRPSLLQGGAEVKGRSLSEPQIAAVVKILRENSALFEAIGCDLDDDSPIDIEASHQKAIAGITSKLTPQHHPNTHAFANQLAAHLQAMKAPLFVQSVLMWELIGLVLQNATLYFATRTPKELGAFIWRIDAKGDRMINEWEQWWTNIVMPMLQSRSIEEPLGLLTGADYSFFSRFDGDRPDWLPVPEDFDEADTPPATNLRMVLMEDFAFDASAETGLELVDIVTNATRRALRGNLQPPGYAGIAGLMIHRPDQYVQMMRFGGEDDPKVIGKGTLVARVLNQYFRNGGRSMIPPGWK